MEIQQPVGPRSCFLCCLTQHDLGEGLPLLLFLSWTWTEFSETPSAYYEGIKLNFSRNSKSWAMLCSPHVCGRMDRCHQSMLLLSTAITDAKHKACTPLAVHLPCSRDSWWSLEGHNSFAAHTNTWIVPTFCRKNKWQGDTFAAQSETIPRLFEQLLAMDVEMIRMSGSLWKGTGLPGRWPTRSFCKDGFHMTSELCMVHAHTHSGWERGAQEWLTLGRKRASLSLSPLFTAMCLLFPTFLHVIWNKKFGQSESQKGLYFSTYSTKFKRILCWGRVAILCLQWWNWHLQIKINYVQ